MGWQASLHRLGLYPFPLLNSRIAAAEALISGVTLGALTASRVLTLDANGRLSGRLPVGWEYNIVADSSAATGDAEAVFSNGSYAYVAGRLEATRIIEYVAQFRVTGQNSTDTHRFRVRLGGLAGTILADTGVLNLANGGRARIHGFATVRTAGASGTVIGDAHITLAAGAANAPLGSTTLNTTISQALAATVVASSANAGNTSVLEAFRTRLI